jgi:hypothetical protein
LAFCLWLFAALLSELFYFLCFSVLFGVAVMFFANSQTGFSYTMAIARGGASMRHFCNLLFLAITAFLLTSCNITQLLPRADLNLSLSPKAQIDIPVEFDLTLGTRTFQFTDLVLEAQARPGSIAANIEKLEFEYFYSNGTPLHILTNDRGTPVKEDGTLVDVSKGEKLVYNPGQRFVVSLSLPVPDGFACKDTPDARCTAASADSYASQGKKEPSTSFSAISLPDAVLFFDSNNYSGAYAAVKVIGVDGNGNPYSKVLSPVTINFQPFNKEQ